MTDTLENLQAQRERALEVAEDGREAIEQLRYERRAYALAAVGGGDQDAMRRAEELDRKVEEQTRKIRTFEAAIVEAEARIAEEISRIEAEERKEKEERKQRLIEERTQHVRRSDELRDSLAEQRRRIMEINTSLYGREAALGELQQAREAEVAAVRDDYARIVEAAKPEVVKAKLADLKRQLAEALPELQQLDWEAGQVAGSHNPADESALKHHRYYRQQEKVERLQKCIAALEEPLANENTVLQIEAWEQRDAEYEEAMSQADGAPIRTVAQFELNERTEVGA